MRIMHLPASFLPYYTGGKEVFVAHLAEELQRLGHDNLVVIHRDNRIPEEVFQYQYGNIPVRVLPPVVVTHEQYWKSEATFDDSFERLLLEFRPDVIHFHDQSGGASLTHLRIAKRLGIKTLLTYHSPGQSCPQRSLLYKGKKLCDGKLDARRCSICLYATKGLPDYMGQIISHLSFSFNNVERSRIKRFLNLSQSVKNFIASFQEIYKLHTGIQIYAHWVKDLLKSNGVCDEKIYYCEQAIPSNIGYNTIVHNNYAVEEKIKLIFLGRCTYIKGIHILIDAVKLLPSDFPIEVYFLGPYWNDTFYGRKLLKRIRGDVRFREPKLLPPSQIIDYICKMDAVVVPSLWPETGPFVVLEAFRAGVPVIGTRAAGIAQRVKHLENGLLFEWGNARDLAENIKILYQRKLKGETFNIPSPPSVSQMASQMLEIYRQL